MNEVAETSVRDPRQKRVAIGRIEAQLIPSHMRHLENPVVELLHLTRDHAQAFGTVLPALLEEELQPQANPQKGFVTGGQHR